MSTGHADIDLIRKYNVRGPRYTSYPTAPQFQESDTEMNLVLADYLVERNIDPRRLSLYFHIPFCYSLCWYCGCTKVITRDKSRSEAYLEYIRRELDYTTALMSPRSEVVQIHLGGGTPTFMEPGELLLLSRMISDRFRYSDDLEMSIEIDPRRLTRAHIEALAAGGFNRASLGVQDTNPDVQKAIHRIQPMEQVEKVTDWLQEYEFDSINYDLIYGLPRQTEETFARTLKEIRQLNPDRLAVYSYAHLPTIMPAQKLLNEEEMPGTDEKLGMLAHAVDDLTDNGYRYIGMDHFAKEEDELSEAMDDGTLQRNFQGYSTQAGSDLYAFGMSGISNVGNWYWQNSKDIQTYYEELDNGDMPVQKVLNLGPDDRLRKEVIMQLMCQPVLEFAPLEERWGISFNDYFAAELEKLQGLEEDGLVQITEKGIYITNTGRLFLRNIAICFDRYLSKRSSSVSYSKTV